MKYKVSIPTLESLVVLESKGKKANESKNRKNRQNSSRKENSTNNWVTHPGGFSKTKRPLQANGVRHLWEEGLQALASLEQSYHRKGALMPSLSPSAGPSLRSPGLAFIVRFCFVLLFFSSSPSIIRRTVSKKKTKRASQWPSASRGEFLSTQNDAT